MTVLSPHDPAAGPALAGLVPPDPIRGATMSMHDPDRPAVTVAQALNLLPDEPVRIGVFEGDSAIPHSRDAVALLIRQARALRLAGPTSRSDGFGLVIDGGDRRTRLVQTDRARLYALMRDLRATQPQAGAA